MKIANSYITFLAVFAILSVGCSTTGYQKADSASTTLQETAQSIDKAIPPLDAVLVAFDNLIDSPSEEYKARFDAYRASVTDFKNSMATVNENAKTMKANGKAYFSQWEAELTKIQNNSIETRSRDRMTDLSERFSSTNEQYARSRAESAPFLSNLTDIRTALATDLTEGGVNSFKGMQKQIHREGEALKEQLVALSSDYKSLATDLSTSSI